MNYLGFRIEFSEEKHLLLKATRNIDFNDVIKAVEKDRILDDFKNPSKKFAHQRILVIKKNKYAWAVPYVIDTKRKVVFLKTIYPSRVLTEKLLKGGIK